MEQPRLAVRQQQLARRPQLELELEQEQEQELLVQRARLFWRHHNRGERFRASKRCCASIH